MKSSDQIADFVLQRIGHIYFRPLMYGGSAEGVELILDNYHEILAELLDKQEEYISARDRICEEQDCGARGFAHQFRETNPNSNEQETSVYVVNQWRKISKCLGLAIPYDNIRNLNKDNDKFNKLFLDD